ncbi:pyridoxamine 5'-phosphate oxidase [Thauera propionica]|uniref:Pyridoxamine 5'-phosphate oxidase n=1 Tax=Thauera propionica TaxID=2019431 RepID=A0A235EWZ1_9RHOO|nr:pyridoxamine 5'-phosphate oxidase family protein [Thauera propionica]OYD52935.1 pyridoxamine 5'-phosphate oxidase [Thauera propionica]
MQIAPETALSLLHLSAFGTLATHSHQLRGYPFATVVPYALDAAHNPVLCISALAEHTKNVLADPRVSLSVVQPGAEDVQDTARLTLVADAVRIESDEALCSRYLRYLPKTEDLLALDFMFFRLQPKRIRYIGGVGRMGWVKEADWASLPALPADLEEQFLTETRPQLNALVRLLGADCFGIDYEVKGERHRQRFPDAPLIAERFATAAPRFAAELC